MQLGFHLANFTWAGAPASLANLLRDTAGAAEDIGATHLSVMDHWFQMEMLGAEKEMLEGYTTLGFLAACTRKIELGMLVTGVTYRYPGLLAKIMTTLDALSGGRAYLGIGAAWYEREHKGLGVPYPPERERFERLEETLQICLQMWSDNDGAFAGKHYQLAETRCVPQPIRRPHPRILIGGAGEKRTLRLVARYADACNLFSRLGADGVKHKLDVLRAHCAAEQRDYDTIEKTLLYVGANPGDDADAFLKEMDGFAQLGITKTIVVPFGPDPVAAVRACASLVPRLDALG